MRMGGAGALTRKGGKKALCENVGMNEHPSKPTLHNPGEALFSSGRLEISAAVLARISEVEVSEIVGRHERGEWNEAAWEDGTPSEHNENHEALTYGYHILSRFQVRGQEVLLHTNRGRTLTRVMLRGEC
jgi:hypothetical protein